MTFPERDQFNDFGMVSWLKSDLKLYSRLKKWANVWFITKNVKMLSENNDETSW